ncbi:unnamed protein product [Miscanthus lutarioriparius]|uniref:Uncharacterized protein n=1 Tax=Miscanthus lutarioriparius TaxID=422564 RepID=A0A811PRE4_9POAL|nr:unnamed protein product [Miscanthus lutarioriparius]
MTESDSDKETTQLKVSVDSPPIDTTYTKEAMQTSCHGDDCNGRDGSTIDITESPWDPSWLFIVHKSVDWKKMSKVLEQRFAWMTKHFPNDIIVPDPTPKGKAYGVHGLHANPNCMNPQGYFPIHEAAERFSVDMIKLLFRHGASANVRTVGDVVVQDLLPLHVAIENTCMHKYLEDNVSPAQYNRDYICKLIHLLCLPEMRRFFAKAHSEVTQLSVYVSYSDTLAFHCIYSYMLPLDRYSISNVNMNHATASNSLDSVVVTDLYDFGVRGFNVASTK